MSKKENRFKKICSVCGDEIPIGLLLNKICTKCLYSSQVKKK